uniref:Sec23/Sec24 trunk domain-containing protein n=1 Tax=Bionectria ochroleuca TaxID=29856 RepID=A0A8H7NIW4_BIOOC
MPPLQNLYQPLCDLPGPRTPMEVQHVQLEQRCSPGLRLGRSFPAECRPLATCGAEPLRRRVCCSPGVHGSPPQPLVYLFLFDVSYNGVANGLLATSARTILDSLNRIPNADRRTRLGFLGVDTSLHYFSIPKDSDENAETSQLVVSDLDEPFLPVPHDLLVPLSESRQSIEKFLQKLPEMFQNNQSNGSCMGSALRSGHKLISALGGKIVVLTSSLPTIGEGKLDHRDDKKVLGTSKESALLQTSNSFYKSFAVECSKNQVSVDMFLFSSQYQDVASLSNLPRYTGGQTWFYPGWHASRPEDALKFASEFSDFLSSEIGLEAVLRVRGTTGLRMNAFYGNFFNRSSDLCAFPAFPVTNVTSLRSPSMRTFLRTTSACRLPFCTPPAMASAVSGS